MKFLAKIIVILLLFFLFGLPSQTLASSPSTAEIFYSEACSACLPYLKETLEPAFKEHGVAVEAKDYINNPEFRLELSERIAQFEIPQEAVGHMMAFIRLTTNDQRPTTIILAGHVPENLIHAALGGGISKSGRDPLVIWQDQMHGQIKSYRIWVKGRTVKDYPVDVPLTEALRQYQNGGPLIKPGQSLLPAVLISGFLDGLNPCAFAILLFLIAFIFMLKKSRLSVVKYSLVYIGAIYLTYLLIGLGLWKAILFTGSPHLMAKVGSVLVIFLGGINLLNYFFPKLPISLRIPMPGRQKILEAMHKGTLPATFLLGILVGLCTFPCSGGIYVAIVGLLAAKVTFTLGLFYLLIYNLMFIVPLLLILTVAGSRVMVEKLTNLEEQNEPRMRLVYGLIMIGIGILILVYFI